MLRRTCLRILMGAAVLTFMAQDWIARVRAAEAPAKMPPNFTPASVSAAITSNNSDKVCAFVLAHPKGAAAAPLADKARMLSLLRTSIGPDVWDSRAIMFDQMQYERAMVTLLRGTESRPAEFRQLIDALGGKASIAKSMPQIRDAELRSLATLGTR